MKINGEEYRLRLTNLPHYVNGVLAPCFVDLDAKEILLADTADPQTLAVLAAKAVVAVYESDTALNPPA